MAWFAKSLGLYCERGNPLPMESRINLQFFQRWFTNHDPDIIPRGVESGASLFASTKIFDEKVEPELLLIHSLWMVRFEINWYFAQDWRLSWELRFLVEKTWAFSIGSISEIVSLPSGAILFSKQDLSQSDSFIKLF